MATTVDLSGNRVGVDYKLTSYNRTNAGDPNGSVTPLFSGEIILDTTNKKMWQAQGIANNTYVEIFPNTYE